MNTLAQTVKDRYSVYNGDVCEVIKGIPDNSIHYTIYSPPFSSLYTYTNSERDMGNCKDDAQFMEHFKFLIPEMLRITMPGRLHSFHCMNLPTSKERHGVIGIRDFRGQLIDAFVKAGWIYHSEVTIWKDPVTAMQRTKALGLLHKQLKKDSAMSRQGIPDYLVTMRKPGDNPERVTHTAEGFPVAMWQRYASPVWATIGEVGDKFAECTSPNRDNPDKNGIDAGYTLQSMKAEKDERHICPLQLQVIERAVELWTNPNDVVFSPFTGIGSEGYQSILQGRRFIGTELKPAYYQQAVKNLEKAEHEAKSEQSDLFADPTKPTAAKSKPKAAKKSPVKSTKRKAACAGAK